MGISRSSMCKSIREADGTKSLIFIDGNSLAIGKFINELGYKTIELPRFLEFPRKDRKYKSHLFMNKRGKSLINPPVIFITCNGHDYIEFSKRGYAIVVVPQWWNASEEKFKAKFPVYLRTRMCSPGGYFKFK